jgi:uncharacterized protein YndB with AHSA1/START domain
MSEDAAAPAPSYPLAAFERVEDRVTARFQLTLASSTDDVWAALTDPARFLDWLAPGEIDPRPGGAVKLNFPDSGIVIDSTISAFEPKRVLEYSWSAPGEPLRPLLFQLEPHGAATGLTLTLTVPATEDAARTAAGWAAHLQMLTAALAGAPIQFPFAVFKAAREAYRTGLATA